MGERPSSHFFSGNRKVRASKVINPIGPAKCTKLPKIGGATASPQTGRVGNQKRAVSFHSGHDIHTPLKKPIATMLTTFSVVDLFLKNTGIQFVRSINLSFVKLISPSSNPRFARFFPVLMQPNGRHLPMFEHCRAKRRSRSRPSQNNCAAWIWR